MSVTMKSFCEFCGVVPDDLTPSLIQLLIDNACIDNAFRLRVWDDGSSEDFECEEDDDFAAIARDHMEEGSWEGPASIGYDWEVTDLVGSLIASGSDVHEIESDHEALIHAVMGDDGCGDDPDAHDWTSEGEGGCEENPGCWSTGGTKMVFQSHCRQCGLHRTEHHMGSQRNPGECDSTEYSAGSDE